MKKLMIVITLIALMAPMQGFAANAKGETIHVGVNGMVCDFCAQSLTKLFKKEKGVDKVDISLEKKLITIDMAPGMTLDDKKINGIVDYAGYEVENIHHTPVK